MQLKAPFMITARLMAGVQVDKTFISIEPCGATSDGRIRYHYCIDAPDWEHEGRDLKSGVGGGPLQGAMETLLAFLTSAAETYRYRMHRTKTDDEDEDPFPPHELSMLALELSENPNLITE
jgi:hypothetical protein